MHSTANDIKLSAGRSAYVKRLTFWETQARHCVYRPSMAFVFIQNAERGSDLPHRLHVFCAVSHTAASPSWSMVYCLKNRAYYILQSYGLQEGNS